MNWILFIILAGVIIVAGTRLSFYADILAVKFRISSTAMGVLLVSIITSLPEITTTLGSICKVDSPDMAIGNIFGSILFNLSIIAVCDIIFRQGGIFRRIHRREAMPAICSLAMISIATAGLIMPYTLNLAGAKLGPGTLLVIAGYIIFFLWMQKAGRLKEMMDLEEVADIESVGIKKAIIAFTICSGLIIVCGIYLAVIGDKLVQSTGMSHSFMGILFLATATSLPELSVGLSAVRRGSLDLLLGTVMGSNMFNILIVAMADLFYIDAALNIPANLGRSNLFSAGGAILATVVAISGLLAGPTRRRKLFGWRSFAIIAIYLACLAVIYTGWI